MGEVAEGPVRLEGGALYNAGPPGLGPGPRRPGVPLGPGQAGPRLGLAPPGPQGAPEQPQNNYGTTTRTIKKLRFFNCSAPHGGFQIEVPKALPPLSKRVCQEQSKNHMFFNCSGIVLELFWGCSGTPWGPRGAAGGPQGPPPPGAPGGAPEGGPGGRTHGIGEASGRFERECGRVVHGTGDCKINARVGVSATTRPSVSCRRVRACPATTRAPRTPDLNVASERGLERCKISARFCAARTRPSLRSTLKSGGRGGNTLCEEREASAASAGSHVRQEKRAFILQSPAQGFPERRFSLELVPHSSHLGL